MTNRPSLRDVAEAAGVGYGTASRALSGRGSVSKATREKVTTAARQLGYRPDPYGQALRSKRTNLVGVILPDLINEFYSEATEVIHAELAKANYHLLVYAAPDVEQQERALATLDAQRVAGLIHVPVPGLSTIHDIPSVQLTRDELGDNAALVACDDFAGFRDLSAMAVSSGYQRVHALLGDARLSTTSTRAGGILASAPEAQLHYGNYTAASGRKLTAQALDDGADSLIVGSPRLMAGVAAELKDRGLRIPDDVGVAAYDDPEWYSLIGPGITCFTPPRATMGTEAVRILRGLMDGTGAPERLFLPGALISRGSLS